MGGRMQPLLPEDGSGLFYDGSNGRIVLLHRNAIKQQFLSDGSITCEDLTAAGDIGATGDITATGDVTGANLVGTIDYTSFDPANMDSGTATLGQVPTADGAAGITWDDPCIVSGGSSTDNALVRWDGTGGDAIQDSSITIDDTDNVAIPSTGSISKPGAGADSEAFGLSAVASAADCVAVGNNASAAADHTTSIGESATNTSGSNCVLVGWHAACNANNSTIVGANASVGAYADCTIMGQNSTCTGAYSVVVGRSSTAVESGTVVGYNSATSAQKGVAVGYSTNVSATGGMALGYNADCGFIGAIALGQEAVATAANRCTIGKASTNEIELQVTKGFAAFGVAPPSSQPTKISDPAGGGTIDAEARTAINAIIDVLEGAGLAASA
jgi:hypothetical protein